MNVSDTVTRDDFYKKGKELYGEDFKNWEFCCSFCGFKQSQSSIVTIMQDKGFHESMRYGQITLDNIQTLKPSIETECLSKDCNFVAYGLVPSTFGKYGGMIVDGKYVFKFAKEANI
jgi:hypothetical protein